MSGYEEYETSYDVDDLDAVMRALVTADFILDVGDRTLKVDIERLTRQVHLYARPDAAGRRRLKLWLDGSRVRGVEQAKAYLNEDEKLQQTVTRARSTRQAMASLNAFVPVVAAFAKERLSVRYRMVDGATFVIAFDRLVAFDPCDLDRTTATVHMEIEGKAGIALRESPFFHARIAPFIRPLRMEDTKWLWASELCQPERSVACETKQQLKDFLRAALGLLTVAPGVLDPLDRSGLHTADRTGLELVEQLRKLPPPITNA